MLFHCCHGFALLFSAKETCPSTPNKNPFFFLGQGVFISGGFSEGTTILRYQSTGFYHVDCSTVLLHGATV
jgi:hypothetical protein